MPAAAVIPAPGVHVIIAETKTSVVGITRRRDRPARRAVLAATSPTARGLRVASVRVRDPNQVIKTSLARWFCMES